MGLGHFRSDLRVVRQGISLLREFGFEAVEEMFRVVELLESSVYERGSLTAAPGGVQFVLRNPPLRMGAFGMVRALWDGAAVDPGAATIRYPEFAQPRRFADISFEAPIVLEVGHRTHFFLPLPTPAEGKHLVRVELRSVAIPPTVWLEFEDHVRMGEE